MTKIDTICARLRDIGVFLIGISAVTMTAFLIYERNNSPEAEMQRSIQKMFTDRMEQSIQDQSERKPVFTR